MNKKEIKEKSTGIIVFSCFVIFFIVLISLLIHYKKECNGQVEEFCLENNFDSYTQYANNYYCTKGTLAIPVIRNDDGVWIVPQISN